MYMDASVLVALVRNEPTQPLLAGMMAPGKDTFYVSDLAIAEAAAGLAARARAQNAGPDLSTANFALLDEWPTKFAEAVEVEQTDIAAANRFVRRPDFALRAPDAIHIAAAHRLGATLLTLDRGMARAAAALGVSYINPVEAEAPGETKD